MGKITLLSIWFNSTGSTHILSGDESGLECRSVKRSVIDNEVRVAAYESIVLLERGPLLDNALFSVRVDLQANTTHRTQVTAPAPIWIQYTWHDSGRSLFGVYEMRRKKKRMGYWIHDFRLVNRASLSREKIVKTRGVLCTLHTVSVSHHSTFGHRKKQTKCPYQLSELRKSYPQK